MRHARATYGYAQQVGAISSTASTMSTLTVKKLYFDVTADVAAADNTSALIEVRGLLQGGVNLESPLVVGTAAPDWSTVRLYKRFLLRLIGPPRDYTHASSCV
eukprot:853713-Pyramimonas_sp.AAC.2